MLGAGRFGRPYSSLKGGKEVNQIVERRLIKRTRGGAPVEMEIMWSPAA
jgi:hypothetical protein